MRSRMPLIADGNSTNTVIRFNAMHVAIQSFSHPVDRELFSFDKLIYRGHALVFNAMINWGRESTACSWWYPPRATDAEMAADMDASIPWNLNGARPDFRLGDCHYSTADNMFCCVAGGDGRLTWFLVHCNKIINEGRHLVENVFSNVKKLRFWNGRDEALRRPYDSDFLAGLFIFCGNLHNMEQRYTESL